MQTFCGLGSFRGGLSFPFTDLPDCIIIIEGKASAEQYLKRHLQHPQGCYC